MNRWLLWLVVAITCANVLSTWGTLAVFGWLTALPAWICLLMRDYDVSRNT